MGTPLEVFYFTDDTDFSGDDDEDDDDDSETESERSDATADRAMRKGGPPLTGKGT